MSAEIENRVLKVIGQTFNLSPDQCQPSLGMGGHPRWDSMGHMELIMNLEAEFNVRFPTRVFTELVSVNQIVAVLASEKNN